MQLLQYAVVVAGLLTNTAVKAMPMAGLEISELVYLLKGFKGEQLTNCDISKAIMPKSSGRSFFIFILQKSCYKSLDVTVNNYHRSQLPHTTR